MSRSVRQSASVPSSERSRRAALRAVSSVRPARSGGAASDAVCRVWKVARSTGVPRPPRLDGRRGASAEPNPAASSGSTATQSPARKPLMPCHLRAYGSAAGQFLRQMQPGEDGGRSGRHPPGCRERHQHHGEEAQGHRPDRGPGQQRVQRSPCREARPGGQRPRAAPPRRRRPARPRRPAGSAGATRCRGRAAGRRRTPTPRRRAPRRPRPARPPTIELAASGTDHGEDRAEPEVPYAARGQHVLGEHAGHRHGQARRGGQERGEGAARQQRAQQVPAEPADHPLGQHAARRRPRPR